MFSALVRSRPLPRAASLVQARQMGGTVKVHACDQEALVGASEVARTEAVVEMGVRYEAGVPTPAEGTNSIEPIVVDSTTASSLGVARTVVSRRV